MHYDNLLPGGQPKPGYDQGGHELPYVPPPTYPSICTPSYTNGTNSDSDTGSFVGFLLFIVLCVGGLYGWVWLHKPSTTVGTNSSSSTTKDGSEKRLPYLTQSLKRSEAESYTIDELRIMRDAIGKKKDIDSGKVILTPVQKKNRNLVIGVLNEKLNEQKAQPESVGTSENSSIGAMEGNSEVNPKTHKPFPTQ